MLGDEPVARAKALVPYLAGMTAGLTLAALGVSFFLPGSFFGAKPGGHLANPSPVTGAMTLLVGIGLVAATVILLRPRADDAASAAPTGPEPHPTDQEDAQEDAHKAAMLAGGAIAGALLLVLVTRDLVIKPENADQPGAIRLLQLFTYNYRRAWPESLDYGAALAGFGAVAIAISLAMTVRAVRRHAVVAMSAFAIVWALWGLDVYMTGTAQHWGQHEVIQAYYADRASPDEVLVAYQMNWKGENFYTGNHVPAFVSTGSTFTNWLKKKKDEGAKVMYFVTEHGRIGGLKSEVGAKKYTELTDKTLCNKFVLVRAEL
jgi:hypothetical protein